MTTPPDPPTDSPPPATPPPEPPAGSPSATTRRTTGLVVAGAVVLVGLLVVAVVLWASADRRHEDNVEAFARAPSGCDTTLDFDRTGTFTLYVETTGELPELSGDCDATVSYDRDADDAPAVTPELRTVDGEAIDLEPADGPSYDTGTYVGIGRNVVAIDEPGEYVITVDDDGGAAFAVAIGGSPDDGVAVLRWGAGAALLLGLLGGGALLVLGARRPESTAGVATPEPDSPSWPTSPPGFPSPPPTTGASGPAPGSIPGQPPIAGPSTAPPSNDDEASPWGPPTA